MKLTQAQLAEVGNVSLNTQHRWEAGGGLPSTEYLFRIGEAGADWVWILTGRSNESELTDVGESRLLNAYRELPDVLQAALVDHADRLRDAVPQVPATGRWQRQTQGQEQGYTLQDRRPDFDAGPER